MKRNRPYNKVKRELGITDDDVAPIFGCKSGKSFNGLRDQDLKKFYEDVFVLCYQLIAPKVEEKIYEKMKNLEL